MGFDKDRAIIAQNSATAAAALLVAEGGFDPDRFDAVRIHIFNGTMALAGAEAVVERIEATSVSAGASEAPVATSAPGGRPGADVELKFGKFRGKTIGAVAKTEDGLSWLEWAGENSSNDFIKSTIRKFLAAA